MQIKKIIIKYRNRKLYDSGTRNYLNLSDIFTLAKDRADFKVINHPEREDITEETLVKAIMSREDFVRSMFNGRTARQVIQSGFFPQEK